MQKVTYQYKYSKGKSLFCCNTTIGLEQLSIKADKDGNIEHQVNLENQKQYNELREKLRDYTSQLKTFIKPTNEIKIGIIYSHFEKNDIFQSSQLLFEIERNHIVAINNYMLQNQFKEESYMEAYEKLNSYLLNVYDYPRIKFKSQDVTTFEEQIEIEYSSFKYFGFKDCEPYNTKQLLFESNRKRIQTVINGFIDYSKQMKNRIKN